MKAAQINEYGGPEVVKTVADAPRPSIKPDQVLVEVHAAGVNPFDRKVRDGAVRMMAELTFPATLGGDLAGVVAAVGAEVQHVKVGDAVYGQAGALSGHGAFAEFAPAAGKAIGLKPASLSFAEAAALPLVGASALQAFETLGLTADQKILIHGGAGGIGTVAIQIAKHLGAYVATTASADSIDYVKALGADEVIDYHAQKFQNILADYDAVFDTIGGETLTDSFQVLKPGGALVSMAGTPDAALAAKHQVQAHYQGTHVTVARLATLAELADSGAIKVHIAQTFSLDEAAAALAALGTPGLQGKIVISVRD